MGLRSFYVCDMINSLFSNLNIFSIFAVDNLIGSNFLHPNPDFYSSSTLEMVVLVVHGQVFIILLIQEYY